MLTLSYINEFRASGTNSTKAAVVFLEDDHEIYVQDTAHPRKYQDLPKNDADKRNNLTCTLHVRTSRDLGERLLCYHPDPFTGELEN